MSTVRANRRRPLRWLKNSLIFICVVGLVRLLQPLTHRAAVAVGGRIGWLAWLLARRERRRALRNLSGVFPALEGGQRRRLARRVFVQMGRNAMECVVLHRRILPSLWPGREGPVSFAGRSLEVLEEALAEKRGVLFVTAHLGNWELMAAMVARCAPVSVLFKPSYDPRFTGMIERFRRHHGVEGIDVSRAGHLRRALSALRSGQVVGVLIDQPVDSGYWLPFLGRPASTSGVVASLTRATRAPVLAGFIHRIQPCQHAISILRIAWEQTPMGPEELTRALSNAVERAIMNHPCQWIWSLDRWRSLDSRALSRGFFNECNLHTSG